MRGKAGKERRRRPLVFEVAGRPVQPVFVGFRGKAKRDVEPCGYYRADVCLLVDITTGELVTRGVSLCSGKDRYSFTRGRRDSFGRAVKILRKQEWVAPDVTHGSTVRALIQLGLDSLHSKTLLQDSGIYCAWLADQPVERNLTLKERKALYIWRKGHGFLTGEEKVYLENLGLMSSAEVDCLLIPVDKALKAGCLGTYSSVPCKKDHGLGARVGGEG